MKNFERKYIYSFLQERLIDQGIKIADATLLHYLEWRFNNREDKTLPYFKTTYAGLCRAMPILDIKPDTMRKKIAKFARKKYINKLAVSGQHLHIAPGNFLAFLHGKKLTGSIYNTTLKQDNLFINNKLLYKTGQATNIDKNIKQLTESFNEVAYD